VSAARPPKIKWAGKVLPGASTKQLAVAGVVLVIFGFGVLATYWAAWVAAMAAVITMIIVGIAAWFALQGLDDARKTRHAQLILSLNQQWASQGLADAFELFWKYSSSGTVTELIDNVHGPEEPTGTEEEKRQFQQDYQTLSAAPNLVETIGVLREDGALTTDVIYRMWAGEIASIYSYWEDALPKLRSHLDEPDLLSHFRALSLDIRARLETAKKDAEAS
jgi:hypothetical protein